MARDYKGRATTHKKSPSISWWRVIMAFILVGVFIYLLFLLNDVDPDHLEKDKIKQQPIVTEIKIPKKEPEKPTYTFYITLPKTEVALPNTEVYTRTREEKVGKGNATKKYFIQVGSFKKASKADRLKAQLALMGLEPKIQKVKVGNTVWNRVVVGNYTQASEVYKDIEKLKDKKIDSQATEMK
ncbi:MAG: SPOR domain-containing protein [Methylococcales bacterium]|nr:SPOR domain-containing protein [Methylococcales bacterium]